MEEPKSQPVTVSVLTLGASEEEAILITVPSHVSLGDVKKALADLFDRPEIFSDGRFLKQMPNGATVNMHDNQKLGSRKQLIYEGPALALAPEAVPLLTLEDFDGFDEKIEVESPRSLRALELQGVSPDGTLSGTARFGRAGSREMLAAGRCLTEAPRKPRALVV
ncbi:unnamed protein product [Durusdinium trenchii]|uniref:Ubiquitin-like domain-containing protein n=1 Tax=Durusdinium trenchii TaxID=1381693 RepID=A0ABP0PKJ7_9DINO